MSPNKWRKTAEGTERSKALHRSQGGQDIEKNLVLSSFFDGKIPKTIEELLNESASKLAPDIMLVGFDRYILDDFTNRVTEII